MEAFKKFDEPRGAVTPELLGAIYAKMEVEAPPKEELEQFIESVYAEREAAEALAKDFPAVTGVPVGDGDCEGSKTRRCYKNPEELRTNFDLSIERVSHQKNVTNMFDIFANTVATYPENNFYGTCSAPGENYSFETYSQVSDRVNAIASALTTLGVSRQQFVGIMLDTCPTWGIIELALWRQAMVPVTLYSTYGKDAIAYIVDHADLEILFTSKKSMEMLSCILEKCPNLKQIVFVGTQEDLDTFTIPEGIQTYIYSEIEAKGKENLVSPVLPTAEDKALVIYTSGTTGNPKGVVHSHSGMVSNAGGCSELVPFGKSDVHMAFLPMAHIMEQFLESLVYAVGASIGFWSGDVRVLMQNVASLRPTKFIAVPRLLNRLYVQLRGAFNALEGAKKAVYDAALASKKAWLAKGCYKSFYDLFVFKKAAAALGGRCGMLATGSAPIDPGMLEFFRIVFSCPVIEGYGMTEVLITNLTYLNDTRTRSSVGPPATSVEIKLADVPEMNYLTSNDPPRGEVCFRGPMNMVCYYKDPVKTKEAVDEDGWFHSGDIGELYPDGSLRLIDRMKHIFKLSQGEYVAPEKLEQSFVHSKFVAQIFINGDSLQSSLVCVVVPDPSCVPVAMKEFNATSEEELLNSEGFKKQVLADINRIGRENGCFGFEIPRAVAFLSTPFDTLGLLTPTFKMKRNAARAQFSSICSELYKSLE